MLVLPALSVAVQVSVFVPVLLVSSGVGEQLALAALLWAGLPLLNAVTTGQGLDHSLLAGDWAMAGFDLTALGCGLFFAWAAGKMLRAPAPAAKRAPKPTKATPALNTEAEAS